MRVPLEFAGAVLGATVLIVVGVLVAIAVHAVGTMFRKKK